MHCNILQDGQGATRENEQDSHNKNSQQEMPRGNSKLTGTSKKSGTKGEVIHTETTQHTFRFIKTRS